MKVVAAGDRNGAGRDKASGVATGDVQGLDRQRWRGIIPGSNVQGPLAPVAEWERVSICSEESLDSTGSIRDGCGGG